MRVIEYLLTRLAPTLLLAGVLISCDDSPGTSLLDVADTAGDVIEDRDIPGDVANVPEGVCAIRVRESNDGTMDRRETWTYDENGKVLTHEWDPDADGTVEYRGTWTYDEDGNPLTYERDGGADGTVDERETSTYHCDIWCQVSVDPDCGCTCDYNDDVCEAAARGTSATCRCDADCSDGLEACGADGHCDTWCPDRVDPDC